MELFKFRRIVAGLLFAAAVVVSTGSMYADARELESAAQRVERDRVLVRQNWVEAISPTSLTPVGDPSAVLPGSTKVSPTADALVSVPRLGLVDLPTRLGSDKATLDAGLGLFEGGSLFGEPGNSVVVGHRTSHARPFENFHLLVSGDLVRVETHAAIYEYRLVRDVVVDDSETWVMDARPAVDLPKTPLLTLITCTPKGSTDQRWVWWGSLTSTTLK